VRPEIGKKKRGEEGAKNGSSRQCVKKKKEKKARAETQTSLRLGRPEAPAGAAEAAAPRPPERAPGKKEQETTPSREKYQGNTKPLHGPRAVYKDAPAIKVKRGVDRKNALSLTRQCAEEDERGVSLEERKR